VFKFKNPVEWASDRDAWNIGKVGFCGVEHRLPNGDQPTATLSLSDSLSEGHWVATLSSKNSDSVASHPIYIVLY
jgi:hypothetical protein